MSCPSELWNTVLTPVLLSFPQVQSRLFPKLSMFLLVGGKLDTIFFVQNFVLSRTVWATIEVEKQNSKLTHGYWKKKSSSSFHCSLLYFGSGLPVWLRDIDVLLGSRPLCGSGGCWDHFTHSLNTYLGPHHYLGIKFNTWFWIPPSQFW